MKKGFICVLLSFIITLILILASCTPETTPMSTTVEPAVTTGTSQTTVVTSVSKTTQAPSTSSVSPSQANWWDKLGEPQYGGTITRRTTSGVIASLKPDPWTYVIGVDFRLWTERLSMPDWTVDRDVYPFTTSWTPQEYLTGLLAESWEQTSPNSIVITIRQGIYWQNKPPVNGREFTAEDVQFNYNRMLGMGSGFTEPNPYYVKNLASVQSVVATGKYTVEFKFKNSSIMNMDTLFTKSNFGFIASEWLEQGDLENWQNAIGTGPWIPTDWVPSVSITFSRNPDYWGCDEHYPDNRIPYADTFKSVAIDDMSTALATIRTGQIDELIEFNGPSLALVQSLAKTNPDIQQAFWPRSGFQLAPRCDKEPFTDVRVRKAMQMSLDIEVIAQSYYRGTVEGTPVGFMHPLLTDWTTPYDQWPKDLQEEYSFNQEKAKQLLAEAGYPNGFKTACNMGNNFDMELMQIIKSYFMEIGIDMEIKVYDMPTLNSLVIAGMYELHYTTETGMLSGPSSFAIRTTGNYQNYTYNNDPFYDAMYQEMTAASSLDEAKRLGKEMDMYIIKQHWTIDTIPYGNSILWQPWIKGYSGEFVGTDIVGLYNARFWVDQDMKKSLGH